MPRYAVGDLQGHLKPLQALLERVEFEPERDELWLVGDLVNRGSDNVGVVRFARSLPHLKAVLGNHDLHLLAVAHGVRPPRRKDTLDDILQADDREELLHWLQQLPLLVRDDAHQQVMTHAGIPACWSVDQATACAHEVEAVLRDPARAADYFQHMYGNEPANWSGELQGIERWRVITNYFTRMRFIGPQHELDFAHKEQPQQTPAGFVPWYEQRQPDGWQIIFGHWAALQGQTGRADCVGLDTGYGWGAWLTLYDLDTGVRYQINPEGTQRVLAPD
ncbi:symmetrical bis(5'-nucleosyl)-tetraphosphatase [Natronospirillum operosum]|uniref:bis(5'-nucleosyl)-tetraphosphatase (symmetrical) n=1 Tax=Natronospirillum operosum TaxID=2759953 RepID=A0A4Z0W9Y3_9GAMM|nr:symmetrical bis(5'-nucleosyl)-tetraphosphatase [Natronospirillum operosum]TGG94952.1 symmetrical bis(5'-nucleosyl)-tetraphosphatase [Natronospirillum operosum]